ncbi:MAG: hypothetical protein B7Z69_00610 [Actinobacteria bacterium 21-73-9]|nr:MAG: hypothetical protein B7Z69_00610 [Actinobacteria bacterium 21-73-9]
MSSAGRVAPPPPRARLHGAGQHVPGRLQDGRPGGLRRGVKIALDDFGTGFASMTELKNLPIEILKLDMTFVRGIVRDNFDKAIVESIIHLSKALNLEVVAEGIESSTIVDKLRELGCHRGQGYLISMPMAASELETLLEAGSVLESLLRSGDVDTFDASDA